MPLQSMNSAVPATIQSAVEGTGTRITGELAAAHMDSSLDCEVGHGIRMGGTP